MFVHRLLPFKNQKLLKFLQHRNISALYISGDKAKETYAALTPYMDFQNTLSDNIALESNLRLRNLNFNLPQLIKDWEIFKKIQTKKALIEQRRRDIAETIRTTQKSDENLIRKLSSEGKALREDLKTLKEMSYSFEDSFVHKYLELPNKIHPRSTNEDHKLLHKHLDPIEKVTEPHLNHESLVEYKDATAFYLKGSAAEFDLNFPYYCSNLFKKHNFVQFSNPDFIRLALVEAAGVPQSELFHVTEHQGADFCHINTLHLCGGGSMISFLGLIAKLTVNPSALPLKLIGIGKQYRNQMVDAKYGLYGTTQSTCVQQFVAAKCFEDAEMEFEKSVQLMGDLYKQLGVHFEIKYLKPQDLIPAEQMRASLQMYSSHLGEYLEIGSVSFYGDYISKRLLFNYKEGKDFKFPYIVAGTVCDVPKLIAIMIESEAKWDGPWMKEEE